MVAGCLSLLLLLALHIQAQPQRQRPQSQWYLTGSKGSDISTPLFAGAHFNISSLFDINDANRLLRRVYYGKVMIEHDIEGEEVEERESKEEDILSLDVKEALQRILGHTSYTLDSSTLYRLVVCYDFAVTEETLQPFEIEVSHIEMRTQKVLETIWRPVEIGKVAALTVVGSNERDGEAWQILLNFDRRGSASVFYFTKISTIAPPRMDSPALGRPSEKGENAIRVLTYNVWHTMPPQWLYGNRDERLYRYNQRISYLASLIIEQSPDVVLLQEVRLDNTFRVHQNDVGNQLEHIVTALQKRACAQRNSDAGGLCDDETDPLWYYIYQPAQSFFDKASSILTRHEEGIAILSRYPIIQTSFILLPRDLSSKDDEHSRILLSVIIMKDGVKVKVSSSHFALSESARDKAVRYMKHMSESDDDDDTMIHIFGGDLNAEPTEPAMLYLQSPAYHSRYPFQDTFLITPIKQRQVMESAWKENGYSFPACNPSKRIDYIFIRNCSHYGVVAKGYKVIGVKPLEYIQEDTVRRRRRQETGKEMEVEIDANGERMVSADTQTLEEDEMRYRRPELGMLDPDSYLWASDHFGIVTDLHINTMEEAGYGE